MPNQWTLHNFVRSGWPQRFSLLHTRTTWWRLEIVSNMSAEKTYWDVYFCAANNRYHVSCIYTLVLAAGFELYLRMNLRETAVVTSQALGCINVWGVSLWRIFTLRHVFLLVKVMHACFVLNVTQLMGPFRLTSC